MLVDTVVEEELLLLNNNNHRLLHKYIDLRICKIE
jgi:hypothetical protein